MVRFTPSILADNLHLVLPRAWKGEKFVDWRGGQPQAASGAQPQAASGAHHGNSSSTIGNDVPRAGWLALFWTEVSLLDVAAVQGLDQWPLLPITTGELASCSILQQARGSGKTRGDTLLAGAIDFWSLLSKLVWVCRFCRRGDLYFDTKCLDTKCLYRKAVIRTTFAVGGIFFNPVHRSSIQTVSMCLFVRVVFFSIIDGTVSRDTLLTVYTFIASRSSSGRPPGSFRAIFSCTALQVVRACPSMLNEIKHRGLAVSLATVRRAETAADERDKVGRSFNGALRKGASGAEAAATGENVLRGLVDP